MSLPKMPQSYWVQAANRVHMVLSGALADEVLDQLPGSQEARRPVVVTLRAS
jgi:hypothetical protein